MPLVLVVDDLSFEREQMRAVVEREGYDCIEAANGCEALARIDERRPDCILTDILMPEMDGVELLTAMRDSGIQIPVICLTADRQEETRQACERLGAVAVFHKPWAPKVVRELLRRVVEGPSPAEDEPRTSVIRH
jgi:CheY-like chemotaxis protein